MKSIEDLITKFENQPKGYGIIVHFAKELNLPKGVSWLSTVNNILFNYGYCFIKEEQSSGLPDGTEYWWNYSEPNKYVLKKI
jgi:hypothetical protein